jgi:mannose-1-phosphate guanylyltransferase/mannose-6-phosphate isomerase
MVVVDTQDALLVCPEGRSQEVRAIAEQLRASGRVEAVEPREVPKPWGAFRVIDRSQRYQVKWLDVTPGERLSLQSHSHRDEHWVVVQGRARVTVEERQIDLSPGEHVRIPREARHRVENPGLERLRLVEVQTGDYLGEDDIVRYEDDYGRVEEG